MLVEKKERDSSVSYGSLVSTPVSYTHLTEAFVNGKQANNCLLYGDAGTGKSTSIKAIANQYYDRGLWKWFC